jgi:lactoylglutathione lyase
MRLEHAAAYFRDFVKYLGAECGEMYHNPATGLSSYFLSFDCGTRLEIMSRPELAESSKASACVGYAHIAFAVGNREKVDELTELLRRDGFSVVSGPRITGDGYYESCISGHEGIEIELTA